MSAKTGKAVFSDMAFVTARYNVTLRNVRYCVHTPCQHRYYNNSIIVVDGNIPVRTAHWSVVIRRPPHRK